MSFIKKLINILKRWLGFETPGSYEKWKNSRLAESDDTTTPDFLGPENYTKEIKFDNTLKLCDPIFSCIEFVFTKLITGAGASAWSEFYTEAFKGGVTELTQILEKLEDIQSKLKELMEMYKNSTYEDYINQRSKFVIDMINAQRYYMQQLQNLEPDDENTKKILKEWSKANISGNSAMVQYQNFIDWILDLKINSNTLYNIYDLYVYNTTPWEHQGYNYREQLRNMDCAAIATNAMLSMLYIKSRTDIDDSVKELQINTISDKLRQYYDYFAAHEVVRHEGKIICQIADTHFEMDNTLWTKDYENHSWMKNGADWDTENQESAWVLAWGDEKGTIAGNNCGKQLYKEEINRIKRYYQGSGKMIWDILFNEMQIVKPTGVSLNDVFIPLATWVGDTPTDNNHRDISFGEVIKSGTDDISKVKIGTVYIEHTGFLWLKLTFRKWSWLDTSKKWYFTNVTWRVSDNWKEK